MSFIILLAIVTLLIYFIIKFYRFTAKYPPGPTPLPFIGNIHQVDLKRQDISNATFAKDFNGIFTVFSPLPIVVISDFELIKEAFLVKGDDFVDRPEGPFFQEAMTYVRNGGVINSNGDNWREQRRMALSILRDLGMGKNLMEELVRDSIGEYLACLKSIEDKDNVDMHWPIQLMIANIINDVLFGYRYKYNDCEPLISYVERFNKMLADLVKSPMLFVGLAFPILNDVPWIGWHTFHKHKQNMRQINSYIVDNVKKVLEKYEPDDEPECFVHAYQKKIGTNPYLDDENLIASCADFFVAGQETTTTTLRWAVLFLAKYQKEQEKLREEVLSIVGKDRIPKMSDKPKMIYAQACVHELQRCANILSTNVLHVTTKYTEIGGYALPKGTFVNGDINYVLAHDPIFEEPNVFRPERYISEDGKSLRKDLVERTIPFSIGKRVCAGEGLARVELFLGLTTTVQHYRIKPREGAEIDLEPRSLTIRFPKEQKIRLEPV